MQLYIMFCVPFVIVSIALMIWSALEILEEKAFLKASFKTTGEVVGLVNAVETKSVSFDTLRGFNVVIPIVKFQTKNGEVYKMKCNKSYGSFDKKYLDVRYNPNDMSEVMIDSFYKVSDYNKYSKLIGGIILFIITFVIAFKIDSFIG